MHRDGRSKRKTAVTCLRTQPLAHLNRHQIGASELMLSEIDETLLSGHKMFGPMRYMAEELETYRSTLRLRRK
jgi:hypothetical protein